MKAEEIQAIAQFMQRVDIKPPEIPMWQQCMRALEKCLIETQKAPEVK